MEFLTTGFIFVSLIAIALYVVGYGTSSPWWRSVVGRSLFALGLVILAVSALAATAIVFGQDYELRPVARLVTWGATAGVSVGLLVAWYRAQRRQK